MDKETCHFLISSITSRNPDAKSAWGRVKPQGARANFLPRVVLLILGGGLLRLESQAHLLSDNVRVVWGKHCTFFSYYCLTEGNKYLHLSTL